jgi:predicted RND superfamily exporter protein
MNCLVLLMSLVLHQNYDSFEGKNQFLNYLCCFVSIFWVLILSLFCGIQFSDSIYYIGEGC